MDAVEKFLWDTKFDVAAAVMGNAAGEFVLVDLDGALDLSTYLGRGLTFCGVLGFADGQCSRKSEPTYEALACMARASLEFAKVIAARLTATGQSVAWLERLHQLPDTREN